MSTRRQRPKKSRGERLTLKDLASHLDLSPATISLVLNHSPVAAAIPEETQQRVFAAARELGYRPNYIAVSLRSQRTNSIGVLVPEVSDPWAAEIVSGIESHLLDSEYHYLLTSHRRSTPKLLQADLELLTRRAVDGMILVATELREPPLLPTVVISGHTRVRGASPPACCSSASTPPTSAAPGRTTRSWSSSRSSSCATPPVRRGPRNRRERRDRGNERGSFRFTQRTVDPMWAVQWIGVRP